MKITEHQLLHLLAICRDTVSVVNANHGGLSPDDRLKLYNQIVGQQDEVLEIIEKEENE